MRRPTGREAEREVRQRISEFIESDRTAITLRDEFNNWFFREDIGFVIDTRSGEMLFGRLEIGPDNKLACIDAVMDDEAALGLELENSGRLSPPEVQRNNESHEMPPAAPAAAGLERVRAQLMLFTKSC